MVISSTPLPLKQAQLRAFHKRLHGWYGAHGRKDLPWRNTRDPYAIYLSEVMLQQTQVKTVLERYYGPFLAAFSTLDALAAAPRDALMKAWEGLGYYSRAANMQKAAQALSCRRMTASAQSQGAQTPSCDEVTLPDTLDELIALPGIGTNTAHAILAFAFRRPVAVMEANVKRVLCRIFALPSPSDKQLFALAQGLVDAEEPFDYNQAMMDIGAMVCTKTRPACMVCPANPICEGKVNPEAYPAPKVKKVTPVRKRVIVAWRNATGEYHLTQREGKFLTGLYGFDEYDVIPAQAGIQLIGHVEQTYSHFRLDADVYVGQLDSRLRGNDNQFYGLQDAGRLPLSRADAKALKLVEAYEAGLASVARRKK